MSENPRRGRQARNFTTNVPKILDLKSSSEQRFFRKLSLGAPVICSMVIWNPFSKFQLFSVLNSSMQSDEFWDWVLTTFNQTAIASYKLMSTVNLQSIHHFLFLFLFMPLDFDNNVKHIFGYFCFMVCFVCLFSFTFVLWFWSSYSVSMHTALFRSNDVKQNRLERQTLKKK